MSPADVFSLIFFFDSASLFVDCKPALTHRHYQTSQLAEKKRVSECDERRIISNAWRNKNVQNFRVKRREREIFLRTKSLVIRKKTIRSWLEWVCVHFRTRSTHLDETSSTVKWGNTRPSRHQSIASRRIRLGAHRTSDTSQRHNDDKRLSRLHRHKDADAAWNERRKQWCHEPRWSTFHSPQL